MSTLIWVNPFTHEEHTRECIANKPVRFSGTLSRPITSTGDIVRDCDWCGQKPARLYRYDGDKHSFCNRQCYTSFHG